MHINWNPDDHFDPFLQASSLDEPRVNPFFSFDDYLTTMTLFLEEEQEKHTQYVTDLFWKVESGQTEMQGEFDYASYELNKFPEFENTLFSSFFVMIYSFMESELIWYCRELATRNPQSVLLSDLAGTNSVEKAINYLVKVQHVEFLKKDNPEWEEIKNFTYLRNCIVHNQGRVDEFFNKRKELLDFIERKDSKIKLESTRCILDKDFCSFALDKIKGFLGSVAAAKKLKVL